MALAEQLKPAISAAIEELQARFGERLSTAESVRLHHGTGEAYHPVSPPDAVVFARNTEDVSEVVKIAARHKVPIIPYGTGTGLEGHTLAVRGGITLDLSEMNEILEVSVEDLDCRVQAGVTRKQLNAHLREVARAAQEAVCDARRAAAACGDEPRRGRVDLHAEQAAVATDQRGPAEARMRR